MRTSSPTYVDAYETAFLQCVIHNHNRKTISEIQSSENEFESVSLFLLSSGPVTVFWVVGNASENSVLITDFLASNQHNGDRLRRVFPLSPFDHSIELTINRDIRDRTYSCVIDGASDVETTLFTYIVRSIGKWIASFLYLSIIESLYSFVSKDLAHITDKKIQSRKNQTIVPIESEEETTATIDNEEIIAHDALTPEQIEELKQKNSHEHSKSIHSVLRCSFINIVLSGYLEKTKNEKVNNVDDDEDLLEFYVGDY